MKLIGKQGYSIIAAALPKSYFSTKGRIPAQSNEIHHYKLGRKRMKV